MSLIQYFTVVISVGVLTFTILRWRLRPEKVFLRIPIIALCVHMLLFYVYVFLNNLGAFPSGSFFDVLRSGDWSAILRAHEILTCLLIAIYGYIRDKEWKEKHQCKKQLTTHS